MSRFIVILLLLIILRLAVKNFTNQLKAAVSPPEPPRPPKIAAQTLVQCSKCGVYVDSSRALKGVGEGAVFCSEECRRQG